MDDAPNNPEMPDRAWVARETIVAPASKDASPLVSGCLVAV